MSKDENKYLGPLYKIFGKNKRSSEDQQPEEQTRELVPLPKNPLTPAKLDAKINYNYKNASLFLDKIASIQTHRQDQEQPTYNLTEIEKYLNQHIQNNKEGIGFPLICASKNFYEAISKTFKYTRSNQTIIFEGKRGTGKNVLANCLNHARNAHQLIELSCTLETLDSFKYTVKEFISMSDRIGIVIRHLDQIEPEHLKVIMPLLSESFPDKFVYITINEGFLNNPFSLHANVIHRIKCKPIIHVPCFKERKKDLLFQSFSNVIHYNKSLDLGYTEVTERFIKDISSYEWEHNAHDLQDSIQNSMINDHGPILKRLMIPETNIKNLICLEEQKDEGQELKLSEQYEKQAVIQALKGAEFNKTEARDILGFKSVNTLNAKIKKYNIPLPDIYPRKRGRKKKDV